MINNFYHKYIYAYFRYLCINAFNNIYVFKATTIKYPRCKKQKQNSNLYTCSYKRFFFYQIRLSLTNYRFKSAHGALQASILNEYALKHLVFMTVIVLNVDSSLSHHLLHHHACHHHHHHFLEHLIEKLFIHLKHPHLLITRKHPNQAVFH